jgi:four helix bundle protein
VAKITTYRDLQTWQKTMSASVSCFALTGKLPDDIRFELTNQIHRAAISIPSNIAEGFNRHSRAAYVNHLRIALGSLAELETQLELSVQLKLLDRSNIQPVTAELEEVGRMLHGLVRSLERAV